MNKCIASDVQEMLPDLLHDAFDDRAKARVEAHLATCASCREDLDVLRMVKSAAIFAPSIDVEGLSDRNLVQLMNEMNDFDALPVSEPEPVLSVDSGDGY